MKSAGGDQNIQKGSVKWWEDQGVLYCWGGALKESLGRAVPLRPSNPDPVRDKNHSKFATLTS